MRGLQGAPRLQIAALCVHPVTSSTHLSFGSPQWTAWGQLPSLGPQTAPSSVHCKGLEGLGTAGGWTGVAHAGLALAGIPAGTTAPERCRQELEGGEGWWDTRFDTRMLEWPVVPRAETLMLGAAIDFPG